MKKYTLASNRFGKYPSKMWWMLYFGITCARNDIHTLDIRVIEIEMMSQKYCQILPIVFLHIRSGMFPLPSIVTS